MKIFITVFIFLVSCASSSGIHNDGIKYRTENMLKQDVKMKRQMQKARAKGTPRKKRNKVKKAKRKFI